MSRIGAGLVSGVWALSLFVAMIGAVLNVPMVWGSGTIYIRADGSIDPPTAPIRREGDLYTFLDDINEPIVVERDNVIVDGAGYKLLGVGAANSRGVDIPGRNNVVVRNMEISAFEYGIYLNRSQNCRVIGNNITNGAMNSRGILVSGSNNAILRNNIKSNFVGIQGGSCNVFENNITSNEHGLILSSCNIVGNNIVGNMHGVYQPSGNTFIHNNFINNPQQTIYVYSSNVWDDGYPSGGNYWSDFKERYYLDAKDVYSGPYQNETGSDGIWDRSYRIDSENKDNYPFVHLYTPSPYHELVVTLTTPDDTTVGDLLSLNATVTNQGSVDETIVEFLLLMNGTVVESVTIPLLKMDGSHTLSYSWTPATKGKYNVTAYADAVSGEKWVGNNQQTKFITVWAVGIKAGDWIKYAYSYKGTHETPYTEWIKVEFLSVEGTTVTMRGTLHLSDGTEQNETFTVNIVGIFPWMYAPVFDTLSGFVMLANTTVGDTAWVGNTTGKPCASITHYTGQAWGSRIKGETEKTYSGILRTVVYAEYSFIEYGPLTCYWDKQTGVLVEVSNARSDGWTAKAIETNMWQAQPSGLPFDQTYLYVLVAVVIAIAAVSLAFVMRRKKKPPEVVTPTASTLPKTLAT